MIGKYRNGNNSAYRPLHVQLTQVSNFTNAEKSMLSADSAEQVVIVASQASQPPETGGYISSFRINRPCARTTGTDTHHFAYVQVLCCCCFRTCRVTGSCATTIQSLHPTNIKMHSTRSVSLNNSSPLGCGLTPHLRCPRHRAPLRLDVRTHTTSGNLVR